MGFEPDRIHGEAFLPVQPGYRLAHLEWQAQPRAIGSTRRKVGHPGHHPIGGRGGGPMRRHFHPNYCRITPSLLAQAGGLIVLSLTPAKGERRASVRRVALALEALRQSGELETDEAIINLLGGGRPEDLRFAKWALNDSSLCEPLWLRNGDMPTNYQTSEVWWASEALWDQGLKPTVNRIRKTVRLPRTLIAMILVDLYDDPSVEGQT
jgi:hypothetical protein